MPLFEYTARNAANGQIQKGQVDVKSKEEVSAYLRKNRMMLVSVREAPKKITLRRAGQRQGQDPRHRDLHPAVRHHDQRRPAAGAVAHHPGAQTENKTLKEVTKAVVHDVESGNTLADAFSQASQGLHRPLRQHGGGR